MTRTLGHILLSNHLPCWEIYKKDDSELTGAKLLNSMYISLPHFLGHSRRWHPSLVYYFSSLGSIFGVSWYSETILLAYCTCIFLGWQQWWIGKHPSGGRYRRVSLFLCNHLNSYTCFGRVKAFFLLRFLQLGSYIRMFDFPERLKRPLIRAMPGIQRWMIMLL